MANKTETLIYGKIPPQATKLEEAILGAIMLERDKLIEVVGIIQKPEVFYTPPHQLIYETALKMHKSGKHVDLLTLTEEMSKNGTIEQAGGYYTVTMLTMSVKNTAKVEEYAMVVQEKYIARELIRISGEIMSSAYNEEDVFELYTKATEQLAETMQATGTDDWRTMSDALMMLSRHMEEVKIKGVGITTGFPSLDEANGGFRGGMFGVIGARPSMGKSALMGCMVVPQAKDGYNVGVISLEMPMKDIAGRMVASETGQPYSDIDFNRLDEMSLKTVLSGMDDLAQLPIFFSDTAKVNLLDITNKAHKLKRKHGLDILYIDYLQLVEEMPGERGNRETTVSKISRGLKTLAMMLDIPIIALCQLNRDVEKRSDKKPQLSDLRESGAIEQDADFVAFLNRPYRMGILQDENGRSLEFYAELDFPKWRNGRPVSIDLDFHPETMRFTEKKKDASPFDEPVMPDKPFAGIKPSYDDTPKKDDLPF